MDSLQNSIRAASAIAPRSQRHRTPRPPGIVAKDIMSTELLLLSPDMLVSEAIQLLVKRGVSGAPVMDERGKLVGILSELDCMNMIASRSFHQEVDNSATAVSELMTLGGITVEPETDLYTIVHKFKQLRVRRLPVMQGDQIVGMVSRRDVLKALHRMYG